MKRNVLVRHKAKARHALGSKLILLGSLSAFGCSSNVADNGNSGDGRSGSPSGSVGAGGAASGTTGTASGATGTGAGATGSGGGVSTAECAGVNPGRAPVRRLTSFEYNNTVATLLNDDTNPANSLPSELLGNGYGNDADQQPVSSFLVEQYGVVAEDIAQRATATPDLLAAMAPCYSTATADTEEACARSFIQDFGARAYRRPLQSDELEELVTLERTIRATNTFEVSLSSIIETVLQSPDFLYRLEFGAPDAADASLVRPSGYEMATRLSYLLWGDMPDETLTAAAASGELSTAEGVLSHATRMVENVDRMRPVLRYFFDHFLPINTLTDLSRDAAQFPTFSPTIGSLMREETQRFLEYVIFQGPGDWPSALTAPYTVLNDQLAAYYGMTDVAIPAGEWQVVPVDTTKRLGLVTQGAIQTGTTISNFTNPVRRGVFLLRHIMCVSLPDPPQSLAGMIKPPDPNLRATGRERYSEHSKDPTCNTCHGIMDPPGFALENYDPVGLWRDQENGVTIDASGELPYLPEPFNGPIDLVTQIAASEMTQDCFAQNWVSYGYGKTLAQEDACSQASVETAFAESGYNIKSLLLALTQTDAFLYLPSQEQL